MIPVVASGWTRVVEYPANHLNDFCLFRGVDERWHAIGIMGTGTWASETSLFHCSSPDLLGQYAIHEPLFVYLEQGPTTNAAPQKHAPFVVVADGLHHIYIRRPWGTNLHLVSPDVFHWPATPEVVFEERDARDACVQRFGGVWHWYYVQRRQVAGCERSCVMLRTSADLRTWSSGRPALVDESREVKHCKLESPFVIEHAGRYWLFVRDRHREDPSHPAPVAVFVSSEPDHFATFATEFPDMQAPELLEHDGRWYVVRVSGVSHACVHTDRDQRGWLEIAEIAFR
jgi:hypothetical protein